MKRWYRVFFKGYFTKSTEKTEGIIEFQSKNIVTGLNHAIKIGKKKDMRVAMIAEITSPTGLTDKL